MSKNQKLDNIIEGCLNLTEAGANFVCLFSLMGFLGAFNWLFDICSHFRPQYFICLLFAILISLKRKRRILIVWSIIAILNVIPILQLYVPGPPAASNSPRLKMLTMNLESINNKNYNAAAECIKTFNPDIITLQEVNYAFGNYLREHLPEYKYNKIVTGELCEGVGIMSKFPLEQITTQQFGQNFPLISAIAKTNIGDIEILAPHPVPPVDWDFWHQQSIFFDGVTELCKLRHTSLLITGDLNATAYGYQLQHFKETSHLSDSSQGFGIQLTWPSAFPPLWINIDQCLFSDDLTAVARKVGPDIGSDHRSLYTEIAKRKISR